jgi:hypothetical protein
MTMSRHAFPILILTATVHYAAAAAVAEPAGISAALRAPAGEQPDFMLNARGVQIYVCKQHGTDPYAYQWTFVAPEATLLDPRAAGRFAGVTSIQRVATRGGAEPATPCDMSRSGQEARVNYTADYYFYKQKPPQVSSRPGTAY